MGELKMNTLGERLIATRKEQGMSQQEVADLIHVSSRSMQAYESDDVVPYRYLRELSEVLEKPMGWILHGDEAPEETGELKPILLDILKELQKISSSVNGGGASHSKKSGAAMQTDHGTTATKPRPATARKKTSARKP